MDKDLHNYLQATEFLDFDHPQVAAFADATAAESHTPVDKAVALYYAVRDQIRYDPYDLRHSRQAMRASAVLAKGSGYCVAKAVLLAALARRQGIPCRLGFADVTNHLSTKRLRDKMGTDLFVFHGYVELWLNQRWVKATPAFNLSLCEKFSVLPLEFDGSCDSIFHPFDREGRRHMEYVQERGTFTDLPFDLMFSVYAATYPLFFEHFGNSQGGDFAGEAADENRSTPPAKPLRRR